MARGVELAICVHTNLPRTVDGLRGLEQELGRTGKEAGAAASGVGLLAHAAGPPCLSPA